MVLENKLKIEIDGEEVKGVSTLECIGAFTEAMIGHIYCKWDGKKIPTKGYYEILEVIDDNTVKVKKWL